MIGKIDRHNETLQTRALVGGKEEIIKSVSLDRSHCSIALRERDQEERRFRGGLEDWSGRKCCISIVSREI